MAKLSEYLDYREFLKEVYEEKKRDNPLISYRALAMRMALDSSQFYRIIHRDLHLPLRAIPRVCEVLGLHGRKSEQFELLVRYGRARSEAEKSSLMERILSFREVERRRLQGREFKVFSEWYSPVIRALACHPGILDVNAIVDRISPEVSRELVEESIELMESQGFLHRQEGGGWVPSEAHLTAGGDVGRIQAVREYQRQILALAAGAIARVPKEQRDISTITVSVDDQALLDIVEILRECRRQIQRRVEECDAPDRVVQMAIAVFPVTKGLGST